MFLKNNLKNATYELLFEDVFSSNEISREIIRIFVKSIKVDDDKINIDFLIRVINLLSPIPQFYLMMK